MRREQSPNRAETSPTEEDSGLRQALTTIEERLARQHGRPRNDTPTDATEELVRTILSQNTNDNNRDRAFTAMRLRLPTWELVATAPKAELAAAIQPGGLAQTKAPRIQNALRQIHQRAGDYDLSFVCQLAATEATAWLTALAGVGPKTAACVLLFSCGEPILPVDTHILRITTRLGLLPGKTSAESAHRILGAAVTPANIYSLHINLIGHGRMICRPQRPRCRECTLRDICLFPTKSV